MYRVLLNKNDKNNVNNTISIPEGPLITSPLQNEEIKVKLLQITKIYAIILHRNEDQI